MRLAGLHQLAGGVLTGGSAQMQPVQIAHFGQVPAVVAAVDFLPADLNRIG